MIPPRLRTYADQRAIDFAKALELRREFIRRLLVLLGAIGAIIFNIMRG